MCQSCLVLGAAVIGAVVGGGRLSDDELAARLAAVGRDAVAAADAVVGRGVGGPAVVRRLRRVLRLGRRPILEGGVTKLNLGTIPRTRNCESRFLRNRAPYPSGTIPQKQKSCHL